MTMEARAERAREPLTDADPLPPLDRVPDRASMLERLYRSQAPRLLRYFARRTSPQEAHDLVSESFLRLANARMTDQAVEREEAYLQRVATNVLRNRARAAFHRTTASLAPDDELPHPSADLTALIETRDELARLEASLLKLNPRTREIFMTHRLDGATYAQIAERMGMTVKGVEWHMSKALALIHRSLDRR